MTHPEPVRRSFARQFLQAHPVTHIDAMRRAAASGKVDPWMKVRDVVDLVGLDRAAWGPGRQFPTPVDAYADMLRSFYAAFPVGKLVGSFVSIGDRVYVQGFHNDAYSNYDEHLRVLSIPLYPDWSPIFMTAEEHADFTRSFFAYHDEQVKIHQEI